MKCFRTMEEIVKARLPTDIEKAVSRSMRNMLDVYGASYDPSAHGKIVLHEQSSTDEDAQQLFGHSWANAPLEGVSYDRENKIFIAVVLLNNELGHVILVQNMPWLPQPFRANLIEHLCGEGPL